MTDKVHNGVPERKPDQMPERRSEYMSDRMPVGCQIICRYEENTHNIMFDMSGNMPIYAK